MAAGIKIDQLAAPPGVSGKAREDLVTGLDISFTATGGPFLSYLWQLVDKPIDIVGGVQSAAVLSAPTANVTLATPVDLPGTYLVQLLVDSGSGLGATEQDVATITAAAALPGSPFNADPTQLPRRQIAFRETTEHNVDDVVFPSGNPRGWAQERLRWDALLSSLFAGKDWSHARVGLTGGGATIVGSALNVASVTRVGVGVVDVLFTAAMPNGNFEVFGGARGPVGGMATSDLEANAGFRIYRADPSGTLVDQPFNFCVKFIGP